MENSLIVENAAKNFGGVRALTGASLHARSKQIQAIIGPNGAGKTTLINIISGVYPPDEGSVTLNGQLLNGMKYCAYFPERGFVCWHDRGSKHLARPQYVDESRCCFLRLVLG